MSKNTGTSELINYFDLGASGAVGIGGNLTLSTIANATVDTDKFLVSDNGIVKYRTGSQLLSDIGGQAAGSYVTLNTDQTITGQKTFEGFNTTIKGTLVLNTFPALPGLILQSYSPNALEIGATILGTTYYSSIVFPSGSQSWNLPNASGTFALTSSLSGYLPLTGGNLTGPLSGTSLNFSGDVQSGTRLIAANGGQQIILTPNLGGGTNRIEATGGLPLALVTTGASLTLAAGGVTPQFTLSSAGLVTLTGALNGTSATFSGLLLTTAGNGLLVGGSGFAFAPSATRGSAQIIGSTDRILAFGSNGNQDAYIYNSASVFQVVSVPSVSFAVGGTERFNLSASTGAATFSSSLKANGSLSGFQGATHNLLIDWSAESQITTLTNTELFFGTNAQRRMTILAGGNVGIGTASPSDKLEIGTTSSGGNLRLVSSVYGVNGIARYFGTDGVEKMQMGALGTNEAYIYTPSGVALSLYAGATERMRITSGGDVLIGTQTLDPRNFSTGNYGIKLERTLSEFAVDTCVFNRTSGDDGQILQFRRNGLTVGSINVSTVSTSYNVTSDYRLKEDLQEINGLEKVQAIKVYDYKWKSQDSRMDGVLAHELAEVLPYAVNGEKDEVNEDGTDKMQGVDYSKIVPILIKAIQEQQEQINQLKNKLS